MATGLICSVGASSRSAALGIFMVAWTGTLAAFCAFVAFRLPVAALLRVLLERAVLMGSVNAHSKSCLLGMVMVLLRGQRVKRMGLRARLLLRRALMLASSALPRGDDIRPWGDGPTDMATSQALRKSGQATINRRCQGNSALAAVRCRCRSVEPCVLWRRHCFEASQNRRPFRLACVGSSRSCVDGGVPGKVCTECCPVLVCSGNGDTDLSPRGLHGVSGRARAPWPNTPPVLGGTWAAGGILGRTRSSWRGVAQGP